MDDMAAWFFFSVTEKDYDTYVPLGLLVWAKYVPQSPMLACRPICYLNVSVYLFIE